MRHARLSLAGVTCLSFLISGCQTLSPPPAVDPLDAQREAYVAAFNAADRAALAALLAPEIAFLPFTGDVIASPERVAAGLSMMASRFRLQLEPAARGVSESIAWEAGTWRHLDRESGAATDGGGYLWVWGRQPDGRWLVVAHSVTRKPKP